MQCPSLLRHCVNLTRAIGLNNCSNIFECNSMFYEAFSLQKTDFFLPISHIDSTSIHSCFGYCSSLIQDINYLFPTAGFQGNIVTTNIFRNCSQLSGTVPAHLLWENTQVNWDISTKNMFLGCSPEIRAQVPFSWGGTNKNLDIKLNIKDPNYYTAFEVFPTLSGIPIGDSSDLSGTVTTEISANSIQIISLRTFIPREESSKADIIIDWGDDSFSTLDNAADFEDTQTNNENEVIYNFSHKYSEQKKYIIKIYGKDYFGIKTTYIKKGVTTVTSASQICRAFDEDLPIAEHVKDLSWMFYASNKLLSVNAVKMKFSLDNATAMFRDCRNLTYVYFSLIKVDFLLL